MLIRKTLYSLILFTGLFASIQEAQANLLDISQSPLVFSKSVPPNLIVTLDDSASMSYGFMADAMGLEDRPSDLGVELPSLTGQAGAGRNSRQAKAAAFNGVYYNPNVEYQVPPGFLAPSYYRAWNNGFNPLGSAVNLDTSYRVLWNVPLDQNPSGYCYTSGVAAALNGVLGGGSNEVCASEDKVFSAVQDGANTLAASGKVVFRLAENPAADFTYAGMIGLSGVEKQAISAALNGLISSATNTAGVDLSAIINRIGVAAIRVVGGTTLVFTAEDQARGVTNEPASCIGHVYTVINNKIKVLDADCDVTMSNAMVSTYTVSLAKRPVPAYYYVPDGLGGLKLQWLYNGQQEQNFANWYSFYRNRALANRTAAHIALQQLPSSVRVGWQTVNDSQTLTGESLKGDFTNTKRDSLFRWLDSQTYTATSSPLQSALKNAGKVALGNPYTDEAGKTYTCQANYHLMLTDGIWNDGSGSLADAAASQYPSGSGEVPPYLPYGERSYGSGDGNSRSAGTPTPVGDDPRNDPNTAPHLVNFFIAPGTLSAPLSEALAPLNTKWDDNQGTYGDERFRNALGSVLWPQAAAGSDNDVYDLWHAAINSHGELISSNNQNNRTLERLRERLGSWITATASPEVVYSQSGAGSQRSAQGEEAAGGGSETPNGHYDVYENRVDSTAWSGDLLKFRHTDQGNGKESAELQWSAARYLTSETGRKIFMSNNLNGLPVLGQSLTNFSWKNLVLQDVLSGNTNLQAAFSINPDSGTLASDNRGQARLNYIRGVRSQEGTKDGEFRVRGNGARTGTSDNKNNPDTVRTRNSVLGDIINSAPMWVGPSLQLKGDLPALYGEGYKGFGRRIAGRDAMVYVGANDGMLHAFTAGGEDGKNGGEEVWAFVPKAVIPNLYKLTGQNYQASHQYYVDGTPTVADAYVKGRWRTVLVGSLGAGGKEIFALDITDPNKPSLLWEITADTKNPNALDVLNPYPYKDLGYTFSQPQVAALPDGKWVVVVGNGYGNQDPAHPQDQQTDKKAALFVIDIDDGSLRSEFVAQAADADGSKANGLSTPVLADYDADGKSDYAYAGDLQGNLWRFDLSQTAKVLPVGDESRLFSTRNNQGFYTPITSKPSLVAHPSRAGYLVVFGTGKYVEQKDALPYSRKPGNPENPYYVYGIWDKNTQANHKKVHQVDNNKLQEQTIESTEGNYRKISKNAVNWDSQEGWKLQLSRTEMVISPVETPGDVLVFSTFTPKDPCESSYDYDSDHRERAGVWTYGVDAASGSVTSKPWITSINGAEDGGGDNNANNFQDVAGYHSGSLAPPTISGAKVFFAGNGVDVMNSISMNINPESAEGQCSGSSLWCSWQILKEDEN